MTYWKSPSFKALQKAWYQRLEDGGFKDAEEIVGEDLVLKQNAEHVYRDTDELQRETKAAYYRLIGQKIHQTQFESVVDAIILTMFAEGAKMKDIHDALMSRRPPCFIDRRRCRMTIRVTIRKYEMEWGLRDYTLRQLNKREAS